VTTEKGYSDVLTSYTTMDHRVVHSQDSNLGLRALNAIFGLLYLCLRMGIALFP